MTDATATAIYLVLAEFDLNSGTRIGFLPSVQGLRETDSVDNLKALLVNLTRSGLFQAYDEKFWDTVDYWDADGLALASDFPLLRLPRPREVMVVRWTSAGPSPRLTGEQSRQLAHTVVEYARKNDPKHRTFENRKDPPAGLLQMPRRLWWRFWK